LATADSKLGVALACGRSNSTTSFVQILQHLFFIGVLPHTDDVSVLKFIEVHWGLSPITARSAQPRRFAELDPHSNVLSLLRMVISSLYHKRRQLKLFKPGVTMRCQSHSNQNIYLVSSHPYVSPFMLHP
jgi:hypothetical protein